MKWGTDGSNLSFLGPCCPHGFLFASFSLSTPWKDLSNSQTFKIIIKGRELLTPYKNSQGDWTLIYANESMNKSVFIAWLLKAWRKTF